MSSAAEPRRVLGSGPLNAAIVLVGEAPGETEERHGIPFCGQSGEELGKMLAEAGLNKNHLRLTNVFKTRPPGNKLEAWCGSKKEMPPGYAFPPLFTAKYLRPEYCGAVGELKDELATLAPNLIITAGSTACWALGLPNISRSRGLVTSIGLQDNGGGQRSVKVLPIYHPAAVLRNWAWRPITIADLLKARHEAAFPELRRPERELWIEPTLTEVKEFFSQFLGAECREVSLDVETKRGQITCISLAPSATLSLCIPFWDPRKDGQSYWSLEDEYVIWKMLASLLRTRVKAGLRTVGQNLLYDIQYLAEQGVRLPFCSDDTMLMHHALHPEMQKGLGFLASIYTNELSWKQMVKDLGRDK